MTNRSQPRSPKPHQATLSQRAVARLATGLIRFLARTIRYDDTELSERLRSLRDGPFIIVIWHNRLALSLTLYQRMVSKQLHGHRMAALVSASQDGATLAEILRNFQVRPIRGSSSRRGAQALKELIQSAEEGFDLAITPDGPRGPRYALKDGILSIAQLTGLPILPVSYHLSQKWTLNSWDRFQIPFPLSKCTVVAAPPLQVPRRLDAHDRDQLRQRLEGILRELTID
tara:strand:- start:1684 stop:2370 length:687 start_codon:yes stop_codon:yes gene_type:complete